MRALFTFLFFLSVCITSLFAGWSDDPSVDTVIDDGGTSVWGHAIVPDGKGGYFICWYGNKSGKDDIYLQRYDKNGDPVWTSTLTVCSQPDYQNDCKMVSDTKGGVVIVWRDRRDGSHYYGYAQRISAEGTPLWTADGVPVLTTTASYCQWLVPDCSGGALVFNDQGEMNRVTSDGGVVWSAPDSCGRYTTDSISRFKVVPDGEGGAFLVYIKSSPYDFYAQRIDKEGNLLWNSGTALRLTDTGFNNCFRMTRCGDGFVIAWYEAVLRAQRVDADGEPQWTDPNGIEVTADAVSNDADYGVQEDSEGGIFITWVNGADDITKIQRIDSDGNDVWAAPVALASSGSTNTWNSGRAQSSITSDGKGGVIAAWIDDDEDLWAQRVDKDGNLLWDSAGVIVCDTPVSSSRYCARMESNGQGSAVIVYVDNRVISNNDLFMKAITSDGTLGTPDFSETTSTVKSTSGGGGCGVTSGVDILIALLALGLTGLFLRRRAAGSRCS